MSVPFIGEVRLFAGNFAPVGWELCRGQIMPISENEALFYLIGTTYGGNGGTTFALPDLRGRVPVHQGTGPGVTPKVLGELAGDESVTLTAQHLPAHTHEQVVVSEYTATSRTAVGNVRAVLTGDNKAYASPSEDVKPDVLRATSSSAGGGQPHENLQPYLSLNYIIAVNGVFPTQS